ARPGDRHRAPRGAAAQDRGQDRQRRPGVFCRGNRPPARRARDRIPRRSRRARQGAAAGRCGGVAVSHRLAGALRPGDDRSDGLRHPRDSIRPGLGPGGHRSGGHGLHRYQHRGSSRLRAARARHRPTRMPPAVRASLRRGAHGARVLLHLPQLRGAVVSAKSVNTAATEFYILAPEVPVPERTFVLKHDETFGLFNDFGDIAAGARHEEGLYRQGSRFLSRLALKLAGGRLLLLSSAVRRDNLVMGVDLTNPDVYLGGNVMLPRGSLHIYRSKLIWGAVCYEHLHVRNFTRTPLDISLSLEFAADFADIFEVRGEERPRRGTLHKPRVTGDAAELAYQGLDGVARRTLIECQPRAKRLSGSELQLAVLLEGRAEQVFEIKVSCAIDVRSPAAMSFQAALARADHSRASGSRLVCDVQTSNDQFNAWMTRSAADL